MSRPRALENVRVVDFSWVRAGPWATRWLGALGAEIIKIEWPENERGRLPSSTTPQGVERSPQRGGTAGLHGERPGLASGRLSSRQSRALARHTPPRQLPWTDGRAAQC